ncbi:sensor histidine kinase [Labrys miyagiensis]|nr:HAMP domain-containing sensor histidine kinase [Labrys miyagiensis]
MVEHETERLARGIHHIDASVHYALPEGLKRYRLPDPFYLARIRTSTGEVLYTNCRAECDEHLLAAEIHPPDFWYRMLSTSKPITVAGGRAFGTGDRKIIVEVAILDDQQQVMWDVLGREFADHLAVPMSILLLFILGGTLVSIALALQPVRRAARQAESIDPLDPMHRVDTSGMPREIAEFGQAINRTLSRIHGLMTAQRVFTAAVAHEIRTPLAMLRLELGNIDHPRAQKMEADVDGLAHFVEQITALGRLDGADRAVLQAIDLVAIARKAVADIAPFVYARGATIAFVDHGADQVEAYLPFVDDAIRNLVENAVKHTPRGTMIDVIAGPGPCLAVVDNAGLLQEGSRDHERPDATGIGLEIVRRIMAFHRGRLDIDVEHGKLTAMRLVFKAKIADGRMVRH